MEGCIIQIVLTVIAFAINPIIGVIWVIAQILGAFNDDDNNNNN